MKIRTEDELREALSRVCKGQPRRSIPRHHSDDDEVLGDAVDELLAIREYDGEIHGLWLRDRGELVNEIAKRGAREAELASVRPRLAEAHARAARLENEIRVRDTAIEALQGEIARLGERCAYAEKEKERLQTQEAEGIANEILARPCAVYGCMEDAAWELELSGKRRRKLRVDVCRKHADEHNVPEVGPKGGSGAVRMSLGTVEIVNPALIAAIESVRGPTRCLCGALVFPTQSKCDGCGSEVSP